MNTRIKNVCPKCQAPLQQGGVEEGPAATGQAYVGNEGSWSKKFPKREAGSGRRIKYTNWFCPTCRKTRMVVPEGA